LFEVILFIFDSLKCFTLFFIKIYRYFPNENKVVTCDATGCHTICQQSPPPATIHHAI